MCRGNSSPLFRAADGKKRAWRFDIAAVMRHDRSMDRRSLECLGHHIVSRRVALGYRNRTDLADSLQFTVRTLADIEHGVRKASPGTYAMLENKLAWTPGSIDTILAGGEPTETVVELRRPPTPSPLIRTPRHRRAVPAPPPRSCCSSYDAASSPPATDATTPGTTGRGLDPHGHWPEQGLADLVRRMALLFESLIFAVTCAPIPGQPRLAV